MEFDNENVSDLDTDLENEIENENPDIQDDDVDGETELETPSEELPPTEPIVEEWKPDFNYKAYGEERVMDEWAHGLVTKDNHEQMRSLFEKSGGFDVIKEKYDKTRTDYDSLNQTYSEVNSKYTNMVNSITMLERQMQAGDYDSVFKTLGLTDQELAKHVLAKYEYQQMDANQRAEVDRQNQLARDYAMSQQQLNQIQETHQQTVRSQHEMEMTRVFSDPQIAPAIEAYNARVSDPEAFRNFVYQQGAYMEQQTGRIPTVQEVVQKSIAMLGLQNPTPAPAAEQTNNQQPNNEPPVVQRKVPPSQFKGASGPVKRKVRTIADLEDEYSKEYGN